MSDARDAPTYSPLPFTWEGRDQSSLLVDDYQCVTFTSAFGQIAAGATFDAVSVNYDDGRIDCYDGDKVIHWVRFELKAVE